MKICDNCGQMFENNRASTYSRCKVCQNGRIWEADSEEESMELIHEYEVF